MLDVALTRAVARGQILTAAVLGFLACGWWLVLLLLLDVIKNLLEIIESGSMAKHSSACAFTSGNIGLYGSCLVKQS